MSESPEDPPDTPPPRQPPGPPPGGPPPGGPPPEGPPSGGPPPGPPQPDGPSRGLGIGAGAAIGSGLFVVSAAVAFNLVVSMLGSVTSAPQIAVLVTFAVVPVAAIVMLFFRRTRRFATGVLIVFAVGWIVVVGPCILPSMMYTM